MNNATIYLPPCLRPYSSSCMVQFSGGTSMSCYYGHTELEPTCSSCREEMYKVRSKIDTYMEELELYLEELEHQMNKVNVVLANLKHEIKYRNL